MGYVTDESSQPIANDQGETPNIRVRLFGGLVVEAPNKTAVKRFRTRKTEALLGFLATYGNSHFPRERLTEMFWPADEPKSARASLSTCLASIRSTCAENGYPEIVSADRFSVWLTPGVRSDLAEFDRIAALADVEVDLNRKATWLRTALDLYKGPYLPGYDDDWVLAEREHRSDEFVRAVRRLLRTLGDLGAKGEAIKTARMAVRSEPTREALTRDLMRLLIAADEPAAAMEAYRQLERSLASAFGLHPSEKAVRLAEFIESHSPVEKATAKSSAQPPAKRPSIPRALSTFVGRHAERDLLASLLSRPDVRLVSLLGFGGVGKSRLARETAADIQSSFADGAIWLGLDGYSSPDSIWSALAQALGIATEKERAVQEALALKKMLLVVDNAEHLLPALALNLHRLLLYCPEVRMVVTSRAPLQIDGEHLVRLGPLGGPDRDDARLFEARILAAHPDQQMSGKNREAIEKFVPHLAGIPLAIEMIAATTPWEAIAELPERVPNVSEMKSSRVDHFGRHEVLSRVIAASAELLSPGARQLLERLWPLEAGFTWEAAQAACDGDVMAAIRELQDSSIVYSTETRHGYRFMILRVVRECVAAEMSTAGRQEGIRFAAEWLCRSVEPLDCLGYRSEQSVIEGIHDADNVVACALLAANEGLADVASDLLTSHAASFKLSDSIPTIIDLAKRLDRYVDVGRRLQLHALMSVLAVIGTFDAEWPTPIIDGYVALAEEAGDPRHLAVAYTYAGLRASWHRRNTSRALEMMERALSISTTKLAPQTGCLTQLWANELLIGLGRIDRVWMSLEYLSGSLRPGLEEQMYYSQVAYAGACSGRYEQGIAASITLRDLCQRWGDFPNYGHSFFLEATNRSYSGDYENSIPLYDRHVEIMRRHASLDHNGIAAGERRAITCCVMAGRLEEARERYARLAPGIMNDLLFAISENDRRSAQKWLTELLETDFETTALDGAAYIFDYAARVVFDAGDVRLAQELCGLSNRLRRDLGLAIPHQFAILRPRVSPIEPVDPVSSRGLVQRVLSLIKVPASR